MSLTIRFTPRLTTEGYFLPLPTVQVHSIYAVQGRATRGPGVLWTVSMHAHFPLINEADAPALGLDISNDNLAFYNEPLPWLGANALGNRQRIDYSLPGYEDRYWSTDCFVTPFISRGTLHFPMREIFRNFTIRRASDAAVELDLRPVAAGLWRRFPADFSP